MKPVVAGLCCAVLLCLGCSPPATIVRTDGTEVRGTLDEDASKPGVLVITEEDGTQTEVAVTDVGAIHHPGSVAGAVGVVLCTIGLVTTLFGVDRFVDGNTDAVFIAGAGAALLIAGTPTVIWALSVGSGSRATEEKAREGQPEPAPEAFLSIRVSF